MSKVSIAGVRIAFPQLFTAVAGGDGEGKPKFSAALLLAKDDLAVKKINAAIKEVADAKWGAKAEATLKSLKAADKICLHDGDNKADYAGYEGNLFINASNSARPTVLHRDKSPLSEADGVIYSGCYVNAIIEIWAQDNKFGKRVNATLSGVQFLKDGDAFSGGRAASADEFEELGEPDSDDI
jgi:hypothetical protein